MIPEALAAPRLAALFSFNTMIPLVLRQMAPLKKWLGYSRFLYLHKRIILCASSPSASKSCK